MKIQLIDAGAPAPAEALQALEAAIGKPLWAAVRRFLSLHDGARPEPQAFFRVGSHNSSGVNRFIPAAKILEERTLIDHLPTTAYPITQDGCGNYAFVDEGRQGSVFFWDHEIPDEPYKVANDFDAFLESLAVYVLSPEAISDAKASEGWVDPRFIHLLRKQK